MRPPLPPVVLDSVLDDPGLVRRLAERNAPYFPVQRYFASAAEMDALSDTRRGTPRANAGAGGRAGAEMMVGPVFRGDWAYDVPLVDGLDPIFENPGFTAAARRIFDAAVVRPQIVYANLSLPMLCGDGGHTDIPAFRGIDRTKYPVWLLVTMGRSGLFEPWRVTIATAVAWFYQGEGGEFTYWPDGPDKPPIKRPPATNSAVVGDNDVMYHRVESIGGADDDMARGLTLDSALRHTGGSAWEIAEGDRVLATYDFSQIRISVSWKAQVFRDADESRTYDTHADDLVLDVVFRRFRDDFASRGEALEMPADPLHDPAFVRRLSAAYHVAPTVYPWGPVS
jgi:hypothetical protein